LNLLFYFFRLKGLFDERDSYATGFEFKPRPVKSYTV